MKEFIIISENLALIRENNKDIEKIKTIKEFLISLEKNENNKYFLHEFSEIKLSTNKLSDELVNQVMLMDKIIDALFEIKQALNNEINWKTSSNFQCIPNCSHCCAYSYYLPPELTNLDNKIKSKLFIEKEGMWKIPQDGSNKRCSFFKIEKANMSNNQYGCEIHHNRPLRCHIYPFFPIIYKNQIHIYREEQIRMKNDLHSLSADNKNTIDYSCPGLLESVDIKLEMENNIKNYIKGCLEVPLLAKTLVVNPNLVIKSNE